MRRRLLVALVGVGVVALAAAPAAWATFGSSATEPQPVATATLAPPRIVQAVGLDQIDPTAVACPTTGECLWVGNNGSNASPASLVEAVDVSAAATTVPAFTVPSAWTLGAGGALACPSTTTCLAAADTGYGWGSVVTWTPSGGWSSTSPSLPVFGPDAIACPSTTTCWLAGQDGVLEWSSGTWAKTADLPGDSVQALACPAATKCMAGIATGGGAGFATWTPSGGWGPVGSPSGLSGDTPLALACPTSTTCLAAVETSDHGVALATWTAGGGWGPPTSAGGLVINRASGVALACPSATTCLLLGNADGVNPIRGMTWTNAGGWGSVEPLPTLAGEDGYSGPISCPSTTLCVSTDGQDLVTWTPSGGWSLGVAIAGPAIRVEWHSPASATSVSIGLFEAFDGECTNSPYDPVVKQQPSGWYTFSGLGSGDVCVAARAHDEAWASTWATAGPIDPEPIPG